MRLSLRCLSLSVLPLGLSHCVSCGCVSIFASLLLDFMSAVESLKAFREARYRLDMLTRSEEAHRSWQLAELSDTQVSHAVHARN